MNLFSSRGRSATLVVALVVGFGSILGCDAGDTNPVSPEKMEQIRQRTDQERANFQPKGGPPPSGGTR